VLLNDHQTGLFAKEDLIAGALLDPVPAESVEHVQQRGRAPGGRARQAAESGDAGQTESAVGFVSQGLGQQRAEEAAGDGQADALGLSGAGELGQGVVIDEDGLLELAAERSTFGVEAVDLVLEILEVPLAGGAVDGLEDFGGVAVERLAADAGALGLLADRAVGPVEDGSRVGDAELGR
jgi:hypothetical protein